MSAALAARLGSEWRIIEAATPVDEDRRLWVHEAIDEPNWRTLYTVTHARSGLCAGKFYTKAGAELFARELLELEDEHDVTLDDWAAGQRTAGLRRLASEATEFERALLVEGL